MHTEMKYADISRDGKTYFPPFWIICFYSLIFFISEHLRLLYEAINEGRVEIQVFFGKGELISTKGVIN